MNNQHTDRWLGVIRSSVAPRTRLTLDPARAALLVIDMNVYFASPAGRSYLPMTEQVIPNLKRLLAFWRSAGAPVIFTRHGHEGEHDLGMLGRFFSDYIRIDEPEAEIIPELSPQDHESIIQKKTYDAFLDTLLTEVLTERGVDQVLVTGVLTHMCCETTARSAFCRGFEVFIAVDAMASSSEERHLGSLLSMADSVAVMMSTAEILDGEI
ncbi:isochorismatase family protein [Gemmatimonadota bacterium]